MDFFTGSDLLSRHFISKGIYKEYSKHQRIIPLLPIFMKVKSLAIQIRTKHSLLTSLIHGSFCCLFTLLIRNSNHCSYKITPIFGITVYLSYLKDSHFLLIVMEEIELADQSSIYLHEEMIHSFLLISGFSLAESKRIIIQLLATVLDRHSLKWILN